jgi:predicted phage terminase large subunit-like protein
MAAHLEAISRGDLTEDGNSPRLLANVPPGTMKSLLVTVFWPAHEWGPLNMPHLRYLGISHNVELAGKFNTSMRRLVTSDWYQSLWGDRVQLTQDQNAKVNFENTAGGFRMACASSSVTGRRADRVLIDDPHSVDDANSDALRSRVIDNFLEAVPSRLTNPVRSAIIVIMQRLHEQDVSGIIHEKDLGYTSLILPMEYDPARRCETGVMWQPPWADKLEPFADPRTVEGELLFPERFPRMVVDREKHHMGSYAVAGQFQQLPVPRGGGILKYDYWQDWDEAAALAHNCEPGRYPAFEYVLASVDTAYTEKQENDPSALTVWGLWTDKQRRKRVMLIYAWAKHLPLHGPRVDRMAGESEDEYKFRAQKSWGLVEWVADSCKRYQVHKLLIEAKASGISVAQEMRRLYAREEWSVQLINPGSLDKVTRAHQVQPMFEAGMVYAPVPVNGQPAYNWAEGVKNECAAFPKGAHDDRVDSLTQGLSWLRSTGMLQMDTEAQYDIDQSILHRGAPLVPIYPV